MTVKNKREKIRFGAVGILNTVIDFSLLFALKSLGFPTIRANTISTTVAFITSFTLNKKIVFKVHGSDLKREISLFIVLTLFGLWVLQPLVFITIGWALPHGYTSSYLTLLMSKIIATCVTMVWNYVTYSRIVFKHQNTKI